MSLGHPNSRNTDRPVLRAVPDPRLDAQRALMAAAFCALIDVILDAPHPVRAANALLSRMTDSGLAVATGDRDSLTLVLLNITATSGNSAQGLLRNWQATARDRIGQGVRA